VSLFGRRDEPPADGGPRTEEERERARLERERRRAERVGQPQAAPPPQPEPAPEPPRAAPAPEPPRAAPAPEPPAPEPSPVVQQPVWDEPPAPAPEPPAPEREPAPEPIDLPRGVVTVDDGDERPVELRRGPSPSVRDLPQVAGPSRPRLPGSPPRRRRRLRRLVLLIPLVLILALAWFLNGLYQPFAGDAHGSVRVTIPQGATASDVGDVLERQGVVDSSFFFSLRARLAGKRDQLKAGSFTLQQDMKYGDALDALTKNPAAPRTINVTVPEGRSISETAPLVRQAGLTGSYRQATRRGAAPKGFPWRKYRVPGSVRTLEGFLFPATYELKPGASARKLVADQLKTFRSTFGGLDQRYAKRKNLTPYDILIIASMVEREAGVAKDRPLISAVIYNRLKQGIPLGIDATLRYRLNNWSRPLRVSELATASPYNTRKHQGLPPTPIGSPGLSSLKAALAPAKVNYLYYVVKPCGNGAHAFSSTDAQFQRDVAAYNRKREQLGGKDPSRC
jgi:UPF0755 protein